MLAAVRNNTARSLRLTQQPPPQHFRLISSNTGSIIAHIKDIWVFTAASSDKAAALFIVILLETTPALGHY